MQTRLLQLAILLICLSGCTNEHTNTPAFYIWKSKLSVQDADTAYLNTLGAPKIYARMFDVDNKGNGAFPTADLIPFAFQQAPDRISVRLRLDGKDKRKLFQLPEPHPQAKERSPDKLHHPPPSDQVQRQNRNTSRR